MRHEPEDQMECPECASAAITAMPYPDMDESMKGPATSAVVPAECDGCGTNFELVYEYNAIAY